jgi:hypothetical protein
MALADGHHPEATAKIGVIGTVNQGGYELAVPRLEDMQG